MPQSETVEEFIPHGQRCEARVFSPDDWWVPCAYPAVAAAVDHGHRFYVCDWHRRMYVSPNDPGLGQQEGSGS